MNHEIKMEKSAFINIYHLHLHTLMCACMYMCTSLVIWILLP